MATHDQVSDWIEAFVRGFDFTRTVAEQVATRAATEFRGADPTQWEPNEERYKRIKQKAYGWDEAPNYRTGQMLSISSLFGSPIVEPLTITMVYGTGDPPDGCWSPWDHRTPSQVRADEGVTDRQKGAWATDGDPSRNRPPRPFYEWDEEIRTAVIEVTAQALHEYILTGS
jgi:hypothetical protein